MTPRAQMPGTIARTTAGVDTAQRSVPTVRCHKVNVTLGSGDTRVVALADIELTVAVHDSLVLWGRSGSGKSTLLHVLGGLLAPTAGSVEFEGHALHAGPEGGAGAGIRGLLRPPGIANVFQSPNLLPHFTVLENVAFAARAADKNAATSSANLPEDPGAPPARPADDDRSRSLDPPSLLRLVGLDGKASHLPSELSGGEAQRAAIARALAQRPRLLLADEPTGHLDSDTAERVLTLIEALQREFGFALVLATHDADVAARFAREVELLDGRIVREEHHS